MLIKFAPAVAGPVQPDPLGIGGDEGPGLLPFAIPAADHAQHRAGDDADHQPRLDAGLDVVELGVMLVAQGQTDQGGRDVQQLRHGPLRAALVADLGQGRDPVRHGLAPGCEGLGGGGRRRRGAHSSSLPSAWQR